MITETRRRLCQNLSTFNLIGGLVVVLLLLFGCTAEEQRARLYGDLPVSTHRLGGSEVVTVSPLYRSPTGGQSVYRVDRR